MTPKIIAKNRCIPCKTQLKSTHFVVRLPKGTRVCAENTIVLAAVTNSPTNRLAVNNFSQAVFGAQGSGGWVQMPGYVQVGLECWKRGSCIIF